MGRKVRSATVHMDYKGVDIADFCTDFSYTSNAYDEIDHMSARLEDRDGRVWQGDRWPLRGDELAPVIVTENWRFNGDRHELACGIFQLDAPELSGPPDTIALRGTALAAVGSVQNQKKTRHWETADLSQIAGDIASGSGYTLEWQGKEQTLYYADQTNEADLAFLSRIVRGYGNGIRVINKTILIMDVAKMEEQAPAFEINRLRPFAAGGAAVINYQFSSGLYDRYRKCSVAWHDTKTGADYSGVYEDASIPRGDVMAIYQKEVSSNQEAAALAKEALLANNRQDITAVLTVTGDTGIKGGLTCTLSGFGGFSGKYLIKSAEHRPMNGYTVRMTLNKVKDLGSLAASKPTQKPKPQPIPGSKRGRR